MICLRSAASSTPLCAFSAFHAVYFSSHHCSEPIGVAGEVVAMGAATGFAPALCCLWTIGAGLCLGGFDWWCQIASPEMALINAAAPVRTPGNELQKEPRFAS